MTDPATRPPARAQPQYPIVQPNDRDIERDVIGAITLQRDALDQIAHHITPQDFYSPGYRAAYEAALELHATGYPVNLSTIAERMRANDTLDEIGGAGNLLATQRFTSPASIRRYADVLIDLTQRRALELAGMRTMQAAADRSTPDPLDIAVSALNTVDVVIDAEPDGIYTSTEIAALHDDHEWLIPGLLGTAERLLVVGAEGAGKSWLLRQMALLTCAGIHPFDLQRIAPATVLLVDLENPQRVLTSAMRQLHGYLDRTGQPGEAIVWHRPGGIDLRTRRDRHALEAILQRRRPQMMVLGPLYKAYRVQARESDELAAGEVQAFFDDMRARYGVAIVLEHHAPKAQGGARREWTPYGSSVWLRWPEYGRTLAPATETDCKTGGKPGESLTVGRFRGDRHPVVWPKRFDRGDAFSVPFTGYWPDGFDRPHIHPQLQEAF